ncbi:MAG: hypothetical protein MUE68_03960 [Bacteroidetes bacterium]|jgi:hypothetical protein|nr:hypothetical protein [Bacteroidota bacterium]
MVRSALFILAAIIAVAFGFDQADQPLTVAATAPQVSVRLTQAEMDCIVGGNTPCIEVGVGAFESCIGTLESAGELDGLADLLACGTVGVYSGVACAISWFFGLFA